MKRAFSGLASKAKSVRVLAMVAAALVAVACFGAATPAHAETYNLAYNFNGVTQVWTTPSASEIPDFLNKGDKVTVKFTYASVNPNSLHGNRILVNTAGNTEYDESASSTVTYSYATSTTISYTYTADSYCSLAMGTFYKEWSSSCHSASITIAVKAITTYKVTYDTNGGDSVDPVTDVKALPATLPTPGNSNKNGATFMGWYYDAACTKEAKAGDAISAYTTLHAKWQISVPQANTGLTYTGAEQRGVNECAANYTLKGATAKAVGSHTATVTPAAGNFWADGTQTAQSVDWSIGQGDPADVTVSVADGGTYDGTAKEPKVTVKLGDNTLPASDYTVSYENNVNAGTNTATAKVALNESSFLGSEADRTKSATFSIAKADAANIENVRVYVSDGGTYDGTAKTPDVTVEFGDATLEANTDYSVVYSNNVNAGKATATVTLKGDNFEGTKEVSQAFNIDPLTAELEWGSTSLTYNGAAQAPVCTVTNAVSGDDVTVTVEGRQTNVTADGESYTATATGFAGGAASNYALPAEDDASLSTTFSIGKKTVTVSGIKAKDKIYNGETAAELDCSAATFDGLCDGDTLTVSGTGTFADDNAGTDKTVTISDLKLGGDLAGNYQLASSGNQSETTATINKRYTQPDWALGTPLIYNGKEQQPSCGVYDVVSKDKGKIFFTLEGTGKDVGKYAIRATGIYGEAASNYWIPDTTTPYVMNETFYIVKKAVTVSGITAMDKTYDTSTHATLDFSNVVIDGVCDGDDLSVYAWGTFADANVGTDKNVYVSSVSLTGESKGNYELSSSKYFYTTASIKPRTVDLNWSNTELTYNGSEQAPTCTASNVLGDDRGKVDVTVSGQQTDANKDGEVYTATATALTGDAASNYTLPTNASKSFTIGKKKISIAGIEAQDKDYDGTIEATLRYSEVSFGGAANGDDEDLTVSATGTFSDANVGKDKTVTISDLTLGGDAAGNYKINTKGSQTQTTATINKRKVAVWGITAKTKEYDGTTAAELDYSKATIDNVVEGDDLTVSGTGKFWQADAAENMPVFIGDLTLAGKSVDNYVLDKESQYYYSFGTITPKDISKADIVLDGKLTYSGASQKQGIKSVTVDGLDVTYDVNEGTDTGTNAGDYTLTVTGTDNFTGTATKKFAIAPKSIEGATVELGDQLVYTGAEQAQGVASVTVDGVNVDTFTVNDNAATDAGDGYKLTVTGTGNFTGTATKGFSVERAPINPVVSIEGWMYGSTANKPSVSAKSNPGNGDVTYEYKSMDADDSEYSSEVPTKAGFYTVRATVAKTANYKGGTATCNFTISKKGVTPIVTMAGWTYGDTASEPVVSDNPSTGAVTFTYFDANGNELDGKPSNAGSYTVRADIAADGNHKACSVVAGFNIAPKDISKADVVLGDALTYNGKLQQQGVTSVTVDGLDVPEFAVSSNTGIDARSYTLTVTGSGNFTGTATKKFTIAPKSIEGADVVLGDSLTYNGKEQKQKVTSVTVDGLAATFDVADNAGTDAKSYTLTVTGTGNFTGSVSKEFAIAPKSIEGADVALGSALTYSGKEQKQKVASVTVDGLNATFDVADNAATDAGDYTLTVTGTGNYTGTATKEFTVTRKDIAEADVELGDSLTCNDQEQEQTVKSVTVDGRELSNDEYEVSNNKATDAGDYKLTITGKGNYTGTATKKFTVAKNPDQAAADKVTEAIEGIGDVKYNAASKEAIEEARKAYDELTDEQKKRVDSETVKKLVDAEDQYKKLDDEVKAAEDAISKIGDVDGSDASKEAIEAAKKAYDALTDEQKAAIDAKYPKAIEKAEGKYDKAVSGADKKSSESKTTVTVTKEKGSKLPATGDASAIATTIAAAGSALAALGIAARRRSRA